jgi:hypothetical protein
VQPISLNLLPFLFFSPQQKSFCGPPSFHLPSLFFLPSAVGSSRLPSLLSDPTGSRRPIFLPLSFSHRHRGPTRQTFPLPLATSYLLTAAPMAVLWTATPTAFPLPSHDTINCTHVHSPRRLASSPTRNAQTPPSPSIHGVPPPEHAPPLRPPPPLPPLPYKRRAWAPQHPAPLLCSNPLARSAAVARDWSSAARRSAAAPISSSASPASPSVEVSSQGP